MFKCEVCEKEHDGKYASGRFCTQKCARAYSTLISRKIRNEKISQTLKTKQSEFHITFCKFCNKQFNTKESCRSHSSLCPYHPKRKEKDVKKENKHLQNIFKNFEDLPKTFKRERILIEQNGKCNKCQLDKWLGELITLEIEHKDGNHQNNNRENLELLCPNCHSMTSTWRGRNKSKGKSGKRVSDDEMLLAIKETVSIRQALLKLGLAAKGGNYMRAKKIRMILDSQ